MRPNLLRSLSAIAVICLLLTNCKKDNNGAAPSSGAQAQLSFSLKADNASFEVNSVDGSTLSTQATPAGVTWTSGVANISAFKLETKRRGLEIEIKSRALATVDIFAPVPASISALLDTGTYREIEIKALLVKTSGSNIPLSLKGNFRTAGGAVVPLQLDFNDDAIIKAEAENVTVDGTKDISTLINIHLNKLLNGVSAASLDAAARVSGTIVISSSVNTAIYARVKENIGISGGSGGFKLHDK